MVSLSRMTGALALLALAGGCTGPQFTEPPTVSLSDAEQALEEAHATRAAEFAALEVQMAEDKLKQARSIAASEEPSNRSRHLAEQAEIDARLAIMKAETERLQQIKRQLEENIELLREELDS
ncbi:DUF4398 domain-containing protein [Thiohalomonas denitrificans]|uniref:DUF4398 domain-containing protein n=1 Tax=Thiohalomonas denitrificans TaxID=415747 RepID=A0A1G5PUP3_9GAMM|nr:DUF4398 domain-containing protein [Thiohalomonas denitrificans]SCZ53253.1 protein of unknown function [Thiohalomonas denitrificans]